MGTARHSASDAALARRDIDRWARRRGYRAAAAGIEALDAVREALEKRRRRGEFAPGFFEENLSSFAYLAGTALRAPRSVIVVAIPAPVHTLLFETGDGRMETVIPPTYLSYRPAFERIRREIAAELLGGDDGIELLKAPYKSLAVGVGLALYGRNNVTYVPGLGSYVQLAAYVLDRSTDAPRPFLGIERRLDRCSACRACVLACPMGAIGEDRFLIRADRCYTLMSESARPIPEDVRPPSPDCLVGCLRCQVVCPENKGVLRKEAAPVSFTSAETAAFLGDPEAAPEGLRRSIREKFEIMAMSEDIPIFRRNLIVLLRWRAWEAGGRP